MRIDAANMATGDAGKHRANLAARHQLGFFHRTLNRLHRGFDVDDHTLLQSARWLGADTDDFDIALDGHFADDRDDLRGADIEPDDQVCLSVFLDIVLLLQIDAQRRLPAGLPLSRPRQSRCCSA